MKSWLDGWTIYLLGVKGHSMAVWVGISWYSQRWRDLRLYIPDLLTCLIRWTWCSDWVGGTVVLRIDFSAELLERLQRTSHISKWYSLMRVWVKLKVTCQPCLILFHYLSCPLCIVCLLSDPFTFCYLCLFLPQLENVIHKSVKLDVTSIPSHVVHNQTATMLEIGTNILTHTAEQTRKLNVVEAKVTTSRHAAALFPWKQISWIWFLTSFLQVLNHTSRIEIQLLENSLSTNKLEKELLLQTSEISRLRDKNR